MGAASLASMIPGVLGKYEVLAFVGFVGWVAGATIRLREGRLRLAGGLQCRPPRQIIWTSMAVYSTESTACMQNFS